MSPLGTAAATAVAERWLGDAAGADIFAPALGAAVEGMFTQLQAATASGPTRDPDRWMRQVFLVPPTLRGEREAADHVAGLMLGWLPDSMRSIGSALGAERDAPGVDVRSHTAGSSLRAAQDMHMRMASVPAYASLGSLPRSVDEFIALGAITPRWGSPDDVGRMVRDLLKRFRGPLSPRVRRFYIAATSELPAMGTRFGIATALAGTELALPVFQSAPRLGEYVHKRLGTEYRTRLRANRVLAERTVYRPSRPPMQLNDAARQEIPIDFSLAALLPARFSPFTSAGTLEDDLVDLTFRQNWEIKPVRTSPGGVLQETWYRMTYNFWATVLLEIGLPVSADWLSGGMDWQDFAPGLLAPFQVSGGVVKPFCIDLLPGMVLYWVLRGLTPEALAAAEAMFLAILLALAREALKRARRLGLAVAKAIAELVEQIALVAKVLAKVLLALVLAVACVVALVLLWKVIAAAAAGAAAAVGALLATVLAAGIIVIIVGKQDERPSESGPQTSRQGPAVTLSLGSCAVSGLPVDAIPQVLATAQRLAIPAYQAAISALGTPPQRTIPVAPPG